MRSEPGDLFALEVGDPERVAVRGRPDRLHHVPQVEATGLERAVALDRERGEPSRVGRDGGAEAYRARASEAVLGRRWRDLIEALL